MKITEFTRWDGHKTEVAVCHCSTCLNHFWIPSDDARFENPSFCPWCGTRFSKTTEVSGPASNDLQSQG